MMANVPRIDLLKVDTEGHDFTILKSIDFNGPFRPALIKVEHKHQRNPYEMELFLKDKGYKTWVELDDIYAIDSNT